MIMRLSILALCILATGVVAESGLRRRLVDEEIAEDDYFCNEDEDENDTSVEFQIASEFKVGSEVTEEPTTAPSKAPTKEPTPSPTKEPCSWADQFEKDKSGCPIVNLDFSTLDPGEYITGQLADTYGVTIKARGKKKGGYTPGGAARVFDTNYPGDGRNGIGDPDLGSPNESCGGPGKGYGGEMGSQYENCIPLNNVLVIQDRDQAQWSDNCGGGYIEFRFTDKVFIKELALLDIEDRQGAEATIKWWWTNPAGELESNFKHTGRAGENGVWRESLDKANIEKLRVVFPGGGAIASLNYTTCTDGGFATYR